MNYFQTQLHDRKNSYCPVQEQWPINYTRRAGDKNNDTNMCHDLRSLERTELIMVKWMCGVSLKDKKRSEDLCSLLVINCVADVVRCGRLRWFGHLERKSVDDWVSACRRLVVEGARGRTATTWFAS